MIIDADVHISPLSGDNRISADEALRRMDRAGVDKALTWLQPSYIPQVAEQNAYIYRSMKQHPDRFLGFGWANPHLGLEVAKEEIKRCVYDYGFYGVKLNGAQNHYHIDDPALSLPLVKEIAKTGRLLAFHVGADAFERTHPVVHMGGSGVPDLSDAAIEFAQECPNMHLVGSCIFATRVWKAIQTLGADRVSFGSDTPFFFTHVEVAKYNAMLDGEVSPEEKHAIMAGNMIRLLGLND